MRLGILATHPVQYHAPLYRALAEAFDLEVFFAHRQSADGQADAGFGVAFEWDVPLLDGYAHRFLANRARRPDVGTFAGCDTPEVAEAIAQGRFDAFIVVGWYTRSHWQAIRACWRTSTPVLMRGDSHLLNPSSLPRRAVKTALYRTFVPRLDACLPVGRRSAAYFRHYGARPDRVFAVPYSVDAAFFAGEATRHRQERAARRARHGLGPDAVVFALVGKLISVKRPLDFVEAIGRLARRVPGVEGLIVGDGPLRSSVEAAIAQTGAPVRLAGFFNQSRMPEAYALADVLVLPSMSETWGLVVNEAMACGLPAVVSDVVGCAPDLVEPGRTGATFPVGDVPALVAAMARVLPLVGTPMLAEALAEKTRAHSTEAAVAAVRRAVETVAAGRRRMHVPSAPAP